MEREQFILSVQKLNVGPITLSQPSEVKPEFINCCYGHNFSVLIEGETYQINLSYFGKEMVSPAFLISSFLRPPLSEEACNGNLSKLQKWWKEEKPSESQFAIFLTKRKQLVFGATHSIENLEEDSIKKLFLEMLDYLPKVAEEVNKIFPSNP